jgi:hypothetical protein
MLSKATSASTKYKKWHPCIMSRFIATHITRCAAKFQVPAALCSALHVPPIIQAVAPYLQHTEEASDACTTAKLRNSSKPKLSPLCGGCCCPAAAVDSSLTQEEPNSLPETLSAARGLSSSKQTVRGKMVGTLAYERHASAQQQTDINHRTSTT